MKELTKYEQFLGHLEHELESSDVIIERFKEIFKDELTALKDSEVKGK